MAYILEWNTKMPMQRMKCHQKNNVFRVLMQANNRSNQPTDQPNEWLSTIEFCLRQSMATASNIRPYQTLNSYRYQQIRISSLCVPWITWFKSIYVAAHRIMSVLIGKSHKDRNKNQMHTTTRIYIQTHRHKKWGPQHENRIRKIPEATQHTEA